SFPASPLSILPASLRFPFPASLPPRFSTRPHPFHRPIREVLPLPNGYPPLDLFDHVAAGLERFIAMSRSHRDSDRSIADLQQADPVFQRHRNLPAGLRLGDNAGTLRFGQ